MTSSITVNCPESLRAKNHKKKNKSIWSKGPWKKARDVWKVGKVCAWCGTDKHIVPHHSTDTDYGTDAYLHLTLCIPLCTKCHHALHKGLYLCPDCKTGYTSSGVCWNCLPQVEKDRHKAWKERTKKILKDFHKADYERQKAWRKKHIKAVTP